MIRLDQSEVQASGEKRGRSKQGENIAEIEKSRAKNRKEKRIEKIRLESDKSSVEQSGSSSVLKNDVEKGEYPIGEGRQTMLAKYTELWNITR